jgi:hypothetical protein
MSAAVANALLTASLVTTGVLFEAWLVIRFFEAPDTLPMLLLIHAGLAATATLLAVLLPREVGRQPLLLLFIISLVFLGPFGIVSTGFAGLLRFAFAWRARPFIEWYETLFPTDAQDRAQALHERVVLRGHGPAARSTVAPFADVLERGTLIEKQAALSLIAAGFRPAFAPALRTALNDPEAAIRVQAASTVAEIERRFVERGEALQARLAARPDDAILIELAQHQEALATAGLLDAGRARGAVTAALTLQLRLAAPGPGMPLRVASVAAVGRMLLRLGRADQAARLLAKADSQVPSMPEILGPYLESLFQLHRFVDLREICRRLSKDSVQTLDESFDDVVRLWADDGEVSVLTVRDA